MVREEMTQRLVSPEDIPDHSTQPGVRESLMRVLVGRRIVIDSCSKDMLLLDSKYTDSEERAIDFLSITLYCRDRQEYRL